MPTENIIKHLLDAFTSKAAKAKKADLPDMVDELGGALNALIATDHPMRTTSSVDITKNRKTTEMVRDDESGGTIKKGMVLTTVKMGLTRDLGHYNSARFDVSTATWGDDTDEGFNEAVERAAARTERKITALVEDIAKKLSEENDNPEEK